jgi:ABC-type bacteriocin/lantibiotic exporter with double-glycine peptidase domain
MDQILDFIHDFIKWTFTLITIVLIDLPLKAVSCILILICGIIWSLIYPLVKRLNAPTWVEYIYGYATQKSVLIAKVIYQLWK